MPEGDIYQGDVVFLLQDNPNRYCFFYEMQSESNQGVAARDVAVHLKDFVVPLMLPMVRIEVTFVCTEAREIHPQTSIVETQAVDLVGDRDDVGQTALPGQCSALAQLFGDADNPDRFNRGRDFWTGFADGIDHENGKWTDVVLQLLQTFYESLPKTFTSTNSNSFRWGHFSRTRAKQNEADPPPVPLHQIFWPIELIRLQHLVKTQRRREPSFPCELLNTFDPNI